MSDQRPIGNFPSNSQKVVKPQITKPEKNVEKIISGDVVARKKPIGKRISEAFTGDDAQAAGNYVLFEVVLPTFKSMLSEAVSQGVERMLFGDARPRSSVGMKGMHTAYNKISSGGNPYSAKMPQMSRPARAAHNFDEIVLESRSEAQEVIDRLVLFVEEYGVATVSDLYSLVGITGSFTDDKWGWTDMRGAEVRMIRGGFLVNLPRPMPLD